MAQEMALQLQESNTNPVSLILLDGSHRWVPATMEDPKKLTNETTDLEVMALNKVYDVLHIVYKVCVYFDEIYEHTHLIMLPITYGSCLVVKKGSSQTSSLQRFNGMKSK